MSTNLLQYKNLIQHLSQDLCYGFEWFRRKDLVLTYFNEVAILLTHGLHALFIYAELVRGKSCGTWRVPGKGSILA